MRRKLYGNKSIVIGTHIMYSLISLIRRRKRRVSVRVVQNYGIVIRSCVVFDLEIKYAFLSDQLLDI